MSEQLLGLVTGILFGALLQQGRVVRFEKQVGAMLLIDMTIFKFMLSAIVVGMVGINLLADLGVISHHVQGTFLGPNLLGGLLFGGGWALTGYCPGTSLGAVGEGRWHAVFAIAGMLVGAALFAETYPLLENNVVTWGVLGPITLPGVLGVSEWIVIPVMVLLFLALFRFFERKGL
jgi:uncharacterized membrane protein YedE/YeeE